MISQHSDKPVILIVDDEPVNISVMTNLLRKDYALKIARDGSAAIKIANRQPKPDLILLDVMMPKIDGFMVSQSLKANDATADIPVIFITAAGKECEALGFHSGAVDYICKPINKATTLLRIQTHIKMARYRKQLQESQKFLNGIVENAPLLIGVVTKQLHVVMTNQHARATLGFQNMQELAGLPLTSTDSGIFITESWRGKRALLQSLTGKNRQLSLTIGNTSGGQRCLDTRFTPLKNADGQVELVLLVGIDITESKQTQDRLRLLAKVFENAMEGIVITDLMGKVVDLNPAYCQITGYSMEEIIASPFGFPQLNEYGADFKNAISHIAQTDGKWQGEIFNRRKNGELLAEWLSITTLHNDNGEPKYYLGVYNDITQLKKREEQLTRINHYDLLTGLPNRILVLDRIQQMVLEARRDNQLAAVCYLDLDGFKVICEQQGVEFCNGILIECANRLTKTVRDVDTVARVGSDEFVILLPQLHKIFDCTRILDRILAAFARDIEIDGIRCSISASIGITLLPQDQSEADTLLRHADHAMYTAKVNGKNRYHFFDADEDLQVRIKKTKLERIQQAFDKQEFELFFQPKVHLINDELVGAEALIRWRHPEQGILSPLEFLPIIDGTELEIKLGEWVISTVLFQQRQWRQSGLITQVAINISPNHLQQAGFVEYLDSELLKYPDLPRNVIQIEILETAALTDIEKALNIMQSCNHLGIHFALDDFGTGYSSLTYLCKLPINTLKIDQIFIREMLEDEASMMVVKGIIALANSFNKSIVAEGIETSIHMEKLAQLGCLIGQGYGIARPMSRYDFQRWAMDRPSLNS